MDKATRVLNLLTCLINKNVVYPSDLIYMSDVSSKSIQRDINTINLFFYESEFWCDQQTKVIYNRRLNGYQLVNTEHNQKSLRLLSLLIKIKSLTPTLHKEIYDFFKKEINGQNIENQKVLMSALNHFNQRDERLPGYNLMSLQRAIMKKLKVRLNIEGQIEKIVVKPLSMMYMHYEYWFTYEYKKKILTIPVRSIISLTILETQFEQVNTENAIVFEISKKIWNQFNQQFSVQNILEENETTLKVEVNCTDLDAFYISYQLAPHAKIIAPQHLINQFVERLDEIKNQYTNFAKTSKG
ncbi:WYL domain-containing protein [Staphylococcus devriesei]|uniref:helix-turn-helix transcriptional regulator n=1 Tax=Staphylococcus devriesei TaxID=586733 RepID=UPI000E68662B|nr:WYL domain-containing protein [Staphylococcus devriesei]RIL69636.1 WYL domain-containing protein [Staphylococcus devriesei]